MAPVELVIAVAEDEQHGQVVDPPAEKLHHVERRRIRPVDVLEHQQPARVVAEEACEHRDDVVRRRVAAEQEVELLDVRGDVEQSSQRPRRVERVASAPERSLLLEIGEPPKKRRLADTGFPRDECDSPLPRAANLVEMLGEGRQLGLPFEELHRSSGDCQDDP